ncbi:MAG: hypothetical protein KBD76_07935 [Bacteriovorax sp.]|jgi:hypothetical protein|nr:hypothetical protein [Bacteriovorax sp.]
MLFINILFLSLSLNAAVLKHERSSVVNKEFDYTEFCQTLGAKHSELISVKSMSEIECMNKSYEVLDFCLKKFPEDKWLTRGYVDQAKKKIICEMSKSVMVSVSCDKRDSLYCLNPKEGCEKLRKIFAHRLEIAHFSLLEKNLNCYFSPSIGDTLEDL